MLVGPTLVGCGVPGSASGGGPTPDNGGAPRVEEFSDLTFASESDYERRPALSTAADGKVQFTSSTLDKTVEIEVTDSAGNPIEGLQIEFAARDGANGIVITDPTGTYGDALILGNPELIAESMPSGKSMLTEGKPLAITVGAIIVIKVVLVTIAIITAYELGTHLAEIADFGIQNFESISLSATTFRAPFGEVVDLMESTLLAGVCAISLAVPAGKIGAEAGRRAVFRWAGKEFSKVLAKELTGFLIERGSELARHSLDEDTEVILKIHHLGNLLPPYISAIEIIIPGEGQSVDTLLEERITVLNPGSYTGTLDCVMTIEGGTSDSMSYFAEQEYVIDEAGLPLDDEGTRILPGYELNEEVEGGSFVLRVGEMTLLDDGLELEIDINARFSDGGEAVAITGDGELVLTQLTENAIENGQTASVTLTADGSEIDGFIDCIGTLNR
jgi:hypothetical protein